ncbi:hypothetical protein AGLY_009160 [Aphis glycines]|uniref:Uncharacterized protein n=1 Tax=Aphis glycines TaxID=307491 RepID=A0A6G0TIN8_APHGL|nr:hypothetical protein AGLY_009160 [Aphis glycines]
MISTINIFVVDTDFIKHISLLDYAGLCCYTPLLITDIGFVHFTICDYFESFAFETQSLKISIYLPFLYFVLEVTVHNGILSKKCNHNVPHIYSRTVIMFTKQFCNYLFGLFFVGILNARDRPKSANFRIPVLVANIFEDFKYQCKIYLDTYHSFNFGPNQSSSNQKLVTEKKIIYILKVSLLPHIILIKRTFLANKSDWMYTAKPKIFLLFLMGEYTKINLNAQQALLFFPSEYICITFISMSTFLTKPKKIFFDNHNINEC